MNLMEFMSKFSTEDDAIEYFLKYIYPNEVICPHCGSKKVYRRKGKRNKMFVCGNCNNDFSIFKNTIFEKSSTDLRIWFYAMSRTLTSRKGFSALQLQREVGITYKTAWRMIKQIRIAMGNELRSNRFQSTVEADETYVGGKPRFKIDFKRGRGTNKTPVVGLIDRDTMKVSTKMALPNEQGKCLSGKQLLEIIDDNCRNKTIMITDDFKGYNILDKEAKDRYSHYSINHSAKYYSDGNGVHTNTIESYWAIVKRGLNGTYHHISKKYMPLYLNEFEYRYNNRNIQESFDKLLRQSILIRRVSFNDEKNYSSTIGYDYDFVEENIWKLDKINEKEDMDKIVELLEQILNEKAENLDDVIWFIKKNLK